MSKIVKDDAGCKGVSHVVETADGKQYAVSSIYLEEFCRISGFTYETAVFKWNKVKHEITNWTDVLMFRYVSEEEMLKEHSEICKNLEQYLQGLR